MAASSSGVSPAASASCASSTARESSAKVVFTSTCEAGGFKSTQRRPGTSANSPSTYALGVSSSRRTKRWRYTSG
jgi:hypothetical protein